MMKKAFMFLAAGLVSASLLSACAPKETEGSDKGDKTRVVTTYSILYDIVKEIGGDHVDIHSLAPVGSNPHEYDPLPKDIQKAADADAVFYNGLNLEAGNAWFDKLMDTAGKSGEDAPVYMMSKGVEPMHLTTKGKETEEDPHAWLDIRNGIKYAENARDGLIEADPDNAESYRKNAADYISKLKSLHDEAKETFAQIPEEKRYLITSEGAFKYFSKAYGFKAGYIWEINSENQGTPDQVKQVVDLIKDEQIPVLFTETSIDPRSMESVAKETGVPIGGKLFTDSIGKQGEDGDSYLKMMKWNIDTIAKNLK